MNGYAKLNVDKIGQLDPKVIKVFKEKQENALIQKLRLWSGANDKQIKSQKNFKAKVVDVYSGDSFSV